MNQKSAIALALSFFLPGIGLVYLGDTQKGIGLFVSSIICNLISMPHMLKSIMFRCKFQYVCQ